MGIYAKLSTGQKEAVARDAAKWLAERLESEFSDGMRAYSSAEFAELSHKPDFIVRDEEQKFRRGFWDGFEYAIDMVELLYRKKGFVRPMEIANILTWFYDKHLTHWRYSWPTCDINRVRCGNYPPHPKLEHESWSEIRERILRRDKKCCRCGDVLRLEVDHIVEVQDGGLPTDDNLRTLCKVCHKGKKEWKSGKSQVLINSQHQH